MTPSKALCAWMSRFCGRMQWTLDRQTVCGMLGPISKCVDGVGRPDCPALASMPVTCYMCGGDAKIAFKGEELGRCPACQGKGTIEMPRKEGER